MKYIALPEKRVRRLSFYLAMEEYVARHIEESDCFFMWQVEPSVIFGRNQLIENEVNLDYCRANHIHTYRRKSGGGCVYADMKNIMFSYITDEDNVNFTFNRYMNMVVLTLTKLGVDARTSGRNDVMIGDRKVSGSAFYRLPGRSIVHSTMLYDTDMRNMVGAITPSNEKLLSKGVESVRQHIALLKDYADISIEDFKAFVRESLCDGEIMLTENDIRGIEELEQEYLAPAFIYGKNPSYTLVKKKRIDGVGELEARMEVKNGHIKAINLVGDYFLIGALDEQILQPLIGTELRAEALREALTGDTADIIMNLKKEDLVGLLLE